MYQRPQTFYKKKTDKSGRQSLSTAQKYTPKVRTSGSDEKTRLEINFHQPNKSVNTNSVRHISPDGGQQGNTRKLPSAETRHHGSGSEAFFPVAKNRCLTFADCRPQTADCRPQTADHRLQTTDYGLHTMDLRP